MEITIGMESFLPIEFDVNDEIADATMEIGTVECAFPEYKGDRIIMPTENEQILQTSNHIIKSNIIIDPIPNNYGKIVYNGSYIRVE